MCYRSLESSETEGRGVVWKAGHAGRREHGSGRAWTAAGKNSEDGLRGWSSSPEARAELT